MPQKLSLVFREDKPADDTPQELGESSVTASVRMTTGALRFGLLEILRELDDTIEVRVRFGDRDDGIWFAVDCISPAPEEQHSEPATPAHSTSVADASTKPPGGFIDPDRVPTDVSVGPADSAVTAREQQPLGVDSFAGQRPYTLRDFREYRERFDSGEASLQEHLAGFARVRGTKDAFVKDLTKQHNAAELKELASRFGCSDVMRSSKRTNAEYVYRVVLQSFVLGNSVRFNPREQTIEDATAREVDGLTEQAWQQYHDGAAKERADLAQALSDPQTLEQFRIAIRENGLVSLSAAQRIHFDELSSNESRAARRARTEEHLTKIEGKRPDAKQKRHKAGEHFLRVADTLEAKTSGSLQAEDGKYDHIRDPLCVKSSAERMPGHLYSDQAMAKTLRSISKAFIAGKAQYLDGVRDATHVDTLITLLRRAKTNRNNEQGNLRMLERPTASEKLDAHPFVIADAGFATYPYPAIDRRHLEDLVAAARNIPGLKRMSRRLEYYLRTHCDKSYVEFVTDPVISFLHDYVLRCRDASIETHPVELGMQDLKQLRAAKIFTSEELRCSLRELIPHLEKRNEDDPA